MPTNYIRISTFWVISSTHLLPSFLHRSIISVSRVWNENTYSSWNRSRLLRWKSAILPHRRPALKQSKDHISDCVPLALCRRCTAGSSWWQVNKASGTLGPPPSAGPAESGRSRCWSVGRWGGGRKSCGSGCLSGVGRPPCRPGGEGGKYVISCSFLFPWKNQFTQKLAFCRQKFYCHHFSSAVTIKGYCLMFLNSLKSSAKCCDTVLHRKLNMKKDFPRLQRGSK